MTPANALSRKRLILETSLTIEYALLALIEIACHKDIDIPLTLRQISVKQHIPPHYLEQILACLREGGIILSYRGYRGGYILTRKPHEIKLLEVVKLINQWRHNPSFEPVTLERTLIGEISLQANIASESVLNSYTLEDLSQQVQSRRQHKWGL